MNAERKKTAQMKAPTMMSGHGDAIAQTAHAANNTETFAIRSLREHNQTERMLSSCVAFAILSA